MMTRRDVEHLESLLKVTMHSYNKKLDDLYDMIKRLEADYKDKDALEYLIPSLKSQMSMIAFETKGNEYMLEPKLKECFYYLKKMSE